MSSFLIKNHGDKEACISLFAEEETDDILG